MDQLRPQHWSFALSTDEGQIVFYRSNLPAEDGEGGFDKGENIPDNIPMWESVENSAELAAAWAQCFATGEPQVLDCYAKRNGRQFRLKMWKLELHDFAIVTHGEWYAEHEPLTETEQQVCRMLTAGRQIAEIAADLEIADTTVSRYRNSAMQKLGVQTREQLGARFC